MDQEVAMPYSAAQRPSIGSQFKEPLEILNYTLRLQLYRPLSRYVVQTFFEDFKAKCLQ